MKQLNQFINSYKIYILIPLILIIWKLILFLYFPKVSTDGPWTLSHLFSFLRGDFNSSSFAHNFDGGIYNTYAQEFLLAPFYFLGESSTIRFVFVGFVFVLLSTFLIKKLLLDKSKFIFLIAIVGFLTSIYTYGFRAETYIAPLTFLFIYLIKNYLNSKKIFSLIFCAIIASFSFLIHPASSLFYVIIIAMVFVQLKFDFKFLIKIGLFGVLSLFILSGFNLLDYIGLFTNSNELSDHSFTLKLLFKYLLFNPYIVLLFLAYYISSNEKFKNIKSVLFLGLVLLLTNFGRSYYFFYLLPCLLFMISSSELKFNFNRRYIFYIPVFIVLCYSLFITHIFPTYQNIENPHLGNHFRKILNEVDQRSSNIKKESNIWVSSQLGMEIIDQPNARLHHHFYKTMANKKIVLKDNDVMFFYNKAKLEGRLNDQVLNDRDDLTVQKIIKPFKGHYRISKPFSKRGKSLGLWKVSVSDK